MILIKALLAGLIGVSLCMANISGTVTDMGNTPLSGVVVQLEKGGQMDTTGPDGYFTIVTTPKASIPCNCTSLPSGLSARIFGNILTVMTSERTALEVSAFDLGGKSVSTMRETLDAGIHKIGLPQRGAGVYLYKVKTGKREFVLKRNAVVGISAGSPATTQGTSIRVSAKQAKTLAAISDVIAATKAGLLNYRCIIGSLDTSGIVIKMIANAGDVTDVDGNVYQTVRIGNQVWMVENLKTTRYRDGTLIPRVTDSTVWEALLSPGYCWYENDSATYNEDYGILYNWYTVSDTNTHRLAPAGLHIPSAAEVEILATYLGGAVESAGKLKETGTEHWESPNKGATNESGFLALPGGFRHYNGKLIGRSFSALGEYGIWWLTTEINAYSASYYFLDFSSFWYWQGNSKEMGCSVRCVRD